MHHIQVGKNTIFGESVKVYDHDHSIDENYIVNKNDFVTSPVIIGANCWIGSNTIILKGVNIVDNVVIGANSLVNKSVLAPGIYVNKNGLLTKIK
nr:DapH/DapD/GlmU-related protein [Enterobacter roggenkampii]